MKRIFGILTLAVVAAQTHGQTVIGGATGPGGLVPTLVSLDLKDAPPAEALAALNRAAGTTLSFKDPAPTQHVTLHADKRPLVEVLLQLRQQMNLGTPSNQTADAQVLGGYPVADEVGTWCVSGPFGFVVNGVGHQLTLEDPGKIISESFGLRVQILAEPNVHILGMPQGFVVSEAVDDKGQSLLDDHAPVLKEGFSTYPNPVLTLPLKHPAEAGRRIAVVKAKASVLAMLKSETVTIKDPVHAEAVTRTAGACKFTLGPLAPAARGYELKVTMESQGAMKDEDWKNLQTAMKRVSGSAALGGTNPRKVTAGPGTVSGAGAQVVVTYTFSTSAPRGQTSVEITDLTMELPADVRAADVPLEFHDLPLP